MGIDFAFFYDFFSGFLVFPQCDIFFSLHFDSIFLIKLKIHTLKEKCWSLISNFKHMATSKRQLHL